MSSGQIFSRIGDLAMKALAVCHGTSAFASGEVLSAWEASPKPQMGAAVANSIVISDAPNAGTFTASGGKGVVRPGRSHGEGVF